MLLLEEKDENEAEAIALWNLNALIIMDVCVQFRIPILSSYEALARAQTVDEKF